ncbi:MAG TPA: hypothetical protein VF405_01635 [Gammaproteobacteria bacterium]
MRHFIPRSFAVASISLIALVNALTGCTYIEAQLQRTAPADTRIKLGWQDRAFVQSNHVDEYTCRGQYTLRCDGAGAITLSCTCVLL